MASPEGIKVSDSQNDESNDQDNGGGNSSDKLERIVERKKFEEVLGKIYFGTLEEQIDLVFNM